MRHNDQGFELSCLIRHGCGAPSSVAEILRGVPKFDEDDIGVTLGFLAGYLGLHGREECRAGRQSKRSEQCWSDKMMRITIQTGCTLKEGEKKFGRVRLVESGRRPHSIQGDCRPRLTHRRIVQGKAHAW